MVQDKRIEKQEQSSVKLTVTVAGKDVQQAYDDLVAKYGKTAQIKGFRKGKVPRNVLERKFGEAFRAEALQDLVEKSLGEVFEEVEEKPLPYTRPTLVDEDLEIVPGEDLTFAVTYDVYPEVALGSYEGLTVERPQVTVTDKDVDRELEELRQRNALTIDKPEGAVAAGDVVTVTMVELDDDDTEVEGTRREGVEFTVGEAHNPYHIDEELIGMERDTPATIEKSFDDEFEHEELRGTTKRVQVTVTDLKERDVPDLDDEFAQDVSDEFETLDDLRKDLRKQIDTRAEDYARGQLVNGLMEQLAETSTVEIPAAMVDTELERSWRSMAQQYRIDPAQLEQLLAMQGQTRETIFAEWRPAAIERLKRSLITQKLIETHEISVSEEEAEAQIRKDAEERKANADQIVEYYKQQGMLSYLQQELAEKKMWDTLIETSTVKKGKKIPYVDAVGENR